MSKIDYKKDYKEIYLPKAAPAIIDVPPMAYIMVDGAGDPGSKEYQDAVAVLYAVSYTVKMNGKKFDNYSDYVVFPLEGLWWIEDGSFDFNKRDNWLWTSMIRQPGFVTTDMLKWVVEAARKKKPALDFSKVRYECFDEGLCVQMMHTGPYADEPGAIEKMEAFMIRSGFINMTGKERKHHEIYLSDPRKTTPEKMKTVLRLPVAWYK